MKYSQGPTCRLAEIVALTLLSILTVSAQQQPVPAASQVADPARQDQQATNPPTAAAKATMYVYRLRLTAGMFNKPPIYVDEKELARMTNGRFFIVNLDPGRHVIRSEHKAAVVTLDVNPGQVYYIRVAWEATAHTARAATTLVPPEQGWAEMSQIEPSNPSDIKDHELAAVGAMPSRPAPVSVAAQGPSAPGSCRSIAVIHASFPSTRFNVVDVFNYPGAYVGQWYLPEQMPNVERDGVKIFLLSKGYTPEDVARAHNFCQSPEGTVADAQLAADITRMIRTLEAANHPGCDLRVVKQLHSADKPGVERWDVKSCDAASSYDVQIIPSPKGGSDFRVVKSKSVPAQDKTTETAAPPPASSQAAAAGAMPEGFVLYEGSKEQFTIGLPKDWMAYDQGQLMRAAGIDRSTGRFGDMVIFYQSKDSTQSLLASPELMGKVDRGELPSFFLQKQHADKGMACTGFSEKAEKKAIGSISNDPEFKGKNAVEAAHAEPADVGGCKGLRIRAKGQRSPGATLVADAYVASDGVTLYMFSLRNPADNYEKNVDIFQKAISTLKLSAAK